jgi:hypothetical protein
MKQQPFPLNRRAFLATAAAGAGGFAFADPKDERLEMAMLGKASADTTLPGTWQILDRPKPIRKLIDRKSLFPPGSRGLVLIDLKMTAFFPFPAKQRSYAIVPLPADIGDEQALLGCHISVRTEKGKDIDFEAKYHQAKGHGVRIAQIAFAGCPPEDPVTVAVKCVLLMPSIIAAPDQVKQTEAIRKLPAKTTKDWKDTPGFPESSIPQGGPAFLNVKPSAAYFQTIYDVFKAADTLVALSTDAKLFTDDPVKALQAKKGPMTARVRVAEKGLAGVARSFYVAAYSQPSLLRGGSTLYSMLAIEDPETGNYFLGRVTSPTPTLGPHPGDLYVTGGLKNEGIPNPYKLPFEKFLPRITAGEFISGDPVTNFKPLALAGTSTAGNKDGPKYQAWLKKIPDEFRDLEKMLTEKSK